MLRRDIFCEKKVTTLKMDELFEQKCLVASKLKECIRDKGYTKVSIASKTDIPCWILDRLLNGRIDDKQTFDYYLLCTGND